jgi:hypothetical protein
MGRRCCIGVVGLILLTSSVLNAGVIPGRWEKVAAENRGTNLILTLKAGERIEGLFKGLTDDAIVVEPPGVGDRTIPKTAVAKIVTADKRSGDLTNGTVIGAVIGGSIVGVPLIIFAASGDVHGSDAASAMLLLFLSAGIGALAGLGIDAAVKGQVTLYEAPKDATK